MWVEDTPDKHRTFALLGPQPVLRGSGIRGDRSGSRTVDLAVMLTFDGETARWWPSASVLHGRYGAGGDRRARPREENVTTWMRTYSCKPRWVRRRR